MDHTAADSELQLVKMFDHAIGAGWNNPVFQQGCSSWRSAILPFKLAGQAEPRMQINTAGNKRTLKKSADLCMKLSTKLTTKPVTYCAL